ncbi:MAG TPA: hypothetical protein VNO30_21720 [Kofleriaceae bacterium]|nr:hypothetical protein [Kofleriaceae bacterium]
MTPKRQTQLARAFVRSRLVRFEPMTVCSCHPDGGHPTAAGARDGARLAGG